ncbi:MAG: XdhC family protein [Baekduia sp.]
MNEVAGELHAAPDGAAIATVIAVRKSAPRPPGSKMAVFPGGRVLGSVSGGCVEGAVVEASADVLTAGAGTVLRFGFTETDAWDVGLPCGGEIDVLLEPVGDPVLGRFLEAEQTGQRMALVTVLEGTDTGTRVLADAETVVASSVTDEELARQLVAAGRARLWSEERGTAIVAGRSVFIDVAAPPPVIVLFGAGEFAQATASAARLLGWRVVVCDPRSQFATPERFPGCKLVVSWPQEAVAEIGGLDPSAAAVVLTHDPKLDDAALDVALRSDAAYVGAMGSRRATADRLERLRAAGLPEELIGRLAAPVGLDLGGDTPAEAAVAIVAEIIATRNGRAGSRLSAGDQPIH